VYGLKVSLDGQVQRPERQGSKLVIKGTFSLMATITSGKQKVSPTKRGMTGHKVKVVVATGDQDQL